MKIDIFDFDEFARINGLAEVTSPIVFARGGSPDPNGLLSNEIFGIDTKSRKNTFAYASLNGHFFHPHIYKSLRRLYRNIEKIVSGEEYYAINENGELVPDDQHGHTGIEWLYNNWSKIDWSRKLNDESSSMREERVSLLSHLKKNEIFVNKIIIIPVFYRDILAKGPSGGGETDPLNNMYTKLIRLGKVLKDRDMFDFTLYGTTYMMQNLLVEIYDTFKRKIEKKNGMIRKYLMGKNVDNCVRSVISCPLYHDNAPEQTGTRFGYVGVPISQILDLDAPFIINWVKNWFDQNFVTNQQQVPVIEVDKKTGEKSVIYRKIYKPEVFFNDKYVTDMMELYMRDPESRFDTIKVPIEKGVYREILFTGKKIDPTSKAEISTIANRPMTLTDLFYIAAEDVTRNQHALITRYPVSDAYGVFVAKVNPVSTLQTEVVQVNGHVYSHYPKQDTTCTRENTGVQFIDTLQFSNSYLAGLGGDYDGDQVTIKLIWSLEANKECGEVMNAKSFFVSPNGENVRAIKYEVYQTFYDMTREPYTTSRHLGNDIKEMLLQRAPKDYTFDFLRSLFGDTSIKRNGKLTIRKSPYETTDIIHLEANEYHNKTACDTTIGRICWNKIMVDRIGLRRFFHYMNDVLIKKNSNKYEKSVTQLLVDDKIDTDTFRTYIDHRDWLGLQLHGLITVSFTDKTVKTPESVKKLRDELFKKYEKELADGDIVVAGKIEKALIEAMVNIIKDDPGFDLYNSGARGDINNHMKNIFLMRGGVLNPNTGKYEIMKTSFNEGLRKEDFTAASNSVVQGAYPKAVGTAATGYLAKQLMAGLQTEVIGDPGSDCGTKFTLEYEFEEDDINDFQNRFIDVNGTKVLINKENANKFVGKKIKLYSPFGCIGVGKNNQCLCEKCAGIQTSKFVGLNSNKVATTLTNLNMKKFHDSTLRFKKIDIDNIFLDPDHVLKFPFTDDGTDVIVNLDYFELYVPTSYFENSFMAENLGGMINLFGITPVGIFKNDTFDHFDTLNIPSWHKYNTFDEEDRIVDLPGVGKTPCKVYKYLKGEKLCIDNLLEDASNSQLMLRFITYGKIPGTVPYGKALNIWRKNKKLNNVNFGVPSVIEEVILSTAYRWKKNPSYKFAKIIGKKPDTSLYDYEMASIRRICQVTSTFTGITFESFDDMVSTSINRSRTGGQETESPLEDLFKL